MSNKTASKYAKEAGLKSLAEAVRMTGRSADTLTRWHKDMPDLFRVVIIGCLESKRIEAIKNAPLSCDCALYRIVPALQ
jgi:hypothetical protein